jgi:hypothetical protein
LCAFSLLHFQETTIRPLPLNFGLTSNHRNEETLQLPRSSPSSNESTFSLPITEKHTLVTHTFTFTLSILILNHFPGSPAKRWVKTQPAESKAFNLPTLNSEEKFIFLKIKFFFDFDSNFHSRIQFRLRFHRFS